MHIKQLEIIMGLLWMIIVGLVVGALAKLVMPGKDPGGMIVTVLLGIGGAVLAGFIGRSLGYYQYTNEVPGLIASVAGAVLVLFLYRLITGRRSNL